MYVLILRGWVVGVLMVARITVGTRRKAGRGRRKGDTHPLFLLFE